MSYAQTIREQVIAARKRHGWSQSQLAEKANLSQSAVSRIESTTRGIDVDEFVRIANVLGFNAGDLLPNSGGLITADVKPLVEQLRSLDPDVRLRTLKVVEQIVGIQDQLLSRPQSPSRQSDNVVPFPSPQAESHREMSDDRIERLTRVMQEAGLAQPRKGARGPEFAGRFYGLASAGEGIELFDEVPEEYRQIPEYYWKKGARGVLKAVGDSMVDVGIFENDLLYVKPTPQPNTRDIVICTLNRKAMVKELRRNGDGEPSQLISKNKAYAPIDIKAGDEIEFFGVVVGRTGDL